MDGWLAVVGWRPWLLVWLAPVSALGQAPMPPVGRPPARVDAPGHTAVIDLQRVLAECVPFQERLAALRVKHAERSSAIDKLRDGLTDMQERCKTFTPGSPNYIEFTNKIIDRESEILAAQKKFDFEANREEATLYRNFYRTIEKEVQAYALRHGISLVLNRKTPESFAADLPAAEALFTQGIFYERGVDITDAILGRRSMQADQLMLPKPTAAAAK